MNDYIPVALNNCQLPLMLEEKAYNVVLWDTTGGEDYDRIRLCSYLGTDILLLCFSLVNPRGFENIRSKWFPEISHHCPKTPFIIVGTKRDLRTDPACLNRLIQKHMSPISFEMGSELAQELHAAAYVETSSLTGEHVQDLFTLAVKVATTGRKKPVWSSFSLGTLWNSLVPRIGSSTSRPASSSTVHHHQQPSDVDVAARYGHSQSQCRTVLINVFQILPHEVWMFIFSFCDPKDLFRLSAVCRDFRALSSSDILWVRFIPETIISSRTNKGVTLKSLFRSTAAFYIYKSGTYLTDDWIFVPRE
ncbi:Rho GTPase protein rac1 [Pelomyxa schiedti]|nr:Rho GTPase protein rac1 [Pelomyxa schiedti]